MIDHPLSSLYEPHHIGPFRKTIEYNFSIFIQIVVQKNETILVEEFLLTRNFSHSVENEQQILSATHFSI